MLASLKAYSRKRKTHDELRDIAQLSFDDILKINPSELSSTIFDRPNSVTLSQKQKLALNIMLAYKKYLDLPENERPYTQEEFIEELKKTNRVVKNEKKLTDQAGDRIASAVIKTTKKVGGKTRRSSRKVKRSRKVKGSRKVKKSSKKFNKSMKNRK